MEKYIYNEQNGLWYELQGDYYIPCLVLDEEDTKPIGMWGRKYLRYIKEHRPVLHTKITVRPFAKNCELSIAGSYAINKREDRMRTHRNAARMSAAGEGLTEPNLSFCPCGAKMQIESCCHTKQI